jgi:hypothetical protein
MNRSALFASFFVLAACSSPSTTTPPPDPVANNGGSVSFPASDVSVDRYPAKCGVQDPPYSSDDHFTLDAIGPKVTPPYATLNVQIKPGLEIGRAYVLDLDPWKPLDGPVVQHQVGPGGTPIDIINTNTEVAHTADGALRMLLSRGADQTTVDANAFTKATVTIQAFPAKTGDPLTVRVQLDFSDGKTLDQTFSAPTGLAYSGCAAG